MKTVVRNHVAALTLLALAAASVVPAPAAAQHWTQYTQPTISAMTLDGDHGLQPGSVLRVRVNATPGANWASATLGDSGIQVPLREQFPGTYLGSHAVRHGDRIDPMQQMSVRLDYAGRLAAQNFSYPATFRALASSTAQADARGPIIERFVMRSPGALERGRELRFRLVGTPGGDAWLDIPGVIRGVDLDEVRPGVYEGTYTVRRRDNLDAFSRAVASLQSGNQRSTAQAVIRGEADTAQRYGTDARGPEITDMSPRHGDRVREDGRTVITAHFADEGSGIDPSSVRMRLNGRDVTDRARITGNGIRFRDDLEAGRYTVELAARDRSGNLGTRSWTFDVVGDDRLGGGPLPLDVTSHSNNAVVDADGAFDIRGRTAPYATVRVQVESVTSVAGFLGLTQPVADQSVQADRYGNFRVAVQPRSLPLPGSRYDVRLSATSGSQTAEERITLQARRG